MSRSAAALIHLCVGLTLGRPPAAEDQLG